MSYMYKTNESSNDINNYCGFFSKYRIYDQRCSKCKSYYLINSTLVKIQVYESEICNKCIYEKDEEGKYYKNCREANCLNCQKNVETKMVDKYYCLWGVICYKSVVRYDIKY